MYFSKDIVAVVNQKIRIRKKDVFPSTVQLTNKVLAIVVDRQTRAVGLTFQETHLQTKFSFSNTTKGVIGNFSPNL